MPLPCRLLFFLLLLSVSARAQEEFVPPAAKLITSFPFHMLTGGIITIKVQFDTYPDTLNFILDTGSGGISLDSATVADLKIETQLSDRTIRGIAGIRRVRFAYNRSMKFPGLTVDSMNFHVNDYEILSSAYGEKVDGIIGFSFLSRYIVMVNYDSSRIFVYSKGRMKYPRGGFLIKPSLINIPVFSVNIKDEKELTPRFYFDTGAGMCLLLSSDFVSDSIFINPKRKFYTTQAEGLGGKAPMRQGVIKQVKIGPYKFKKVPTYIFDDEYNVTSYPYLGGLIGNDLLRRFNLILNYGRRDLYLIPNSHFKDAFDYSYTGLGIYMIDGEIEVVDVMPNSPSEAAGLKPGDVIMAVSNNFSRNIQTYKSLLQIPGQKVKILIMREGEPLIVTLKVKSIL
jgi:hypothetical protein